MSPLPSESELIARIRKRAGAPPAWVTLGIGDDAAVIEPERGMLSVITTDSLVEDVHFRRAWTSARNIGHKALATSASDLAAMGARPRAALLSLALPAGLRLDEFDDLIDGFVTLGTAIGAPLVGGNITRSPGPLVVDTTAIGSVGRRGVLGRGGGRPGDELYVTGRLGASATGLAILRASTDRASLSPDEAACIEHYERPDARTRCGAVVGRTRSARACVDLSDGLADAARQLASASGAGVVIEASAVPVHPGAIAWATRTGLDPLSVVLGGGEDYELLFAVAPRTRRAFHGALKRCPGLAATRIGQLTAEPGAWLTNDGRQQPLEGGYAHF